MEQEPNAFHKHNPIQCYAAARIIDSQLRVKYLQANPGNGKTNMILMALNDIYKKTGK